MLFSFCFRLQTHQVLSEAKKSDADKRGKLLDLYVRTEQFLDQLDTDFIGTLQTSLANFKTTLKENIKNVGPRDQYIILIAGKSLRVFIKKKRDIKNERCYCFFKWFLIDLFTICSFRRFMVFS